MHKTSLYREMISKNQGERSQMTLPGLYYCKMPVVDIKEAS